MGCNNYEHSSLNSKAYQTLKMKGLHSFDMSRHVKLPVTLCNIPDQNPQCQHCVNVKSQHVRMLKWQFKGSESGHDMLHLIVHLENLEKPESHACNFS